MSTVTQINSKTWIIAKSKGNLSNYQTKLNSYSILGVKSKKEDKRPIALLRNKQKEYKKFLKEVFAERMIIDEKYLNKKLKERFGASTWYRKRMLDLGMITTKNRIVKLTENTPTNE